MALAAQAALSPPIDVPPDQARLPVWQGLRVIEESPEWPLTPDLAAEYAASGEAAGIDSPLRTHGRGIPPHWGLFSLRNAEASPQATLLAIETTTQYDTRLYERDEAGVWRQVPSVAEETGSRIGGGTPFPVWALQLPPHRITDFLLRVEGPAIVRFPVFTYQAAGLAEQLRKTHLLAGAATGICLLIGAYIGVLRRYLDDASVPLFIGILVADLVGALWLSGLLTEWFPAAPESWLSPVGFTAYAALVGFGSLHAGIYLDTAAWAPKAHRALQLIGWTSLALTPWFPMAFPAPARDILVWGGTVVSMTLVVVSAFAIRRKVPLSGFIAAVWLSYLFVTAAFLVARVFDQPHLWWANTMALVQAIVVALLFGLAMSQRLMRQRDILENARQKAVMDAALIHERSLLFAATAHDLRQPLFGVGMFADLLKSSPASAEREEHARKLELALREVDGLLVGIQQLANVHDASHRPVLETVRLDDVLAPVIEEYRARGAGKRITVRYVPSRRTITTHVPYLQRIVRNVLANAVRYAEDGDRILVGCRRAGGLRLVIADTGRGMTEEQMAAAFDPFRRFDAAPDGFGLGLFSVKSLATALGMRVDLRSRSGHGTEFSLTCEPTTDCR